MDTEWFERNLKIVYWSPKYIRGTTVLSSSWKRTVISPAIALQNKLYTYRDWSHFCLCCLSPNITSSLCELLVHGTETGLHGRLLNYISHSCTFSWRDLYLRLQRFDSCWQKYSSSHRSYPYQTGYTSRHSHHGRCAITETNFHLVYWYSRSTAVVAQSDDVQTEKCHLKDIWMHLLSQKGGYWHITMSFFPSSSVGFV